MLRLLCSLTFAVLLVGCGSSAPMLESGSALAQSVSVDGEASEWSGDLRPVESASLTLGVRNDDDALYLAIVSSDADVVRHVLLTGLVVWLDPEAGNDPALGVHFPLGLVRDGQMPDLAALRRGQQSEADRGERLEAMLGELALIREGTPTVYGRGDVPGLETDARLDGGTLTLELRIPIRGEGALAPGLLPGAEVGVGVETPALDREALRAQMRERMGERGAMGGRRGGMGGDVGGRRGGMGGGMGGSRGGAQGRRAGLPDPVEAWVRVALAS